MSIKSLPHAYDPEGVPRHEITSLVQHVIVAFIGIASSILKWHFSLSDLYFLLWNTATTSNRLRYMAATLFQISGAIALPVLLLKLIQRFCQDVKSTKWFCRILLSFISISYYLIMILFQVRGGRGGSYLNLYSFFGISTIAIIIYQWERWSYEGDIIDGRRENLVTNKSLTFDDGLSSVADETIKLENQVLNTQIKRLLILDHPFYTYIQASLVLYSFANSIGYTFNNLLCHSAFYHVNHAIGSFLFRLNLFLISLFVFVKIGSRMINDINERMANDKIEPDRLMAMELSCTIIVMATHIFKKVLFKPQILYIKITSWMVMSHYEQRSSNNRRTLKLLCQNVIILLSTFILQLSGNYLYDKGYFSIMKRS